MSDYLFRGNLAKLDPEVYELTQLEAERQARKLILIASESTAPMATREALASAFQNIYAEGYPDEESRWMTEEEILDYPMRLAHYRRNSDPRYYKGVEYADVVEALARRRAAETFAANGYTDEWADRNGQTNADGLLPRNSEWEVKVSGSVDLPLGFEVGGTAARRFDVGFSVDWFHRQSRDVELLFSTGDADAVRINSADTMTGPQILVLATPVFLALIALEFAVGRRADIEGQIAVAAGAPMGRVELISADGKVVMQAPLVALEAVEEGGFFRRIWDGIRLFFRGLFG